jgi:glycine betaine/proline transport system substrate-binding protein
VLAAASFHSTPARAADCGDAERVTISEFSWLSASLEAHVVQRILAEGYGCNAVLQPGDTVPTATSMLQKSEPDIAPELWVSNMSEIWGKIQEKGNVYKANDIFADGGKEGLWIPRYVAEANPGLKTIHDLPDYVDLFTEPGTGGKGRIYGCPPGWACEIIISNLYKAMDYDEKGFESEVFSPGSGANLKATIARKAAREQPVVSYYWAPTAVVGRYDLVRLEIPEGHRGQRWDCLTNRNCENPEVSDWPTGEVAVAVTTELREKAPDVARMLERMQYPNAVINGLLGWADERSEEPEAAAERFLKMHEDVWTQWVPAEVAEKVKASL